MEFVDAARLDEATAVSGVGNRTSSPSSALPLPFLPSSSSSSARITSKKVAARAKFRRGGMEPRVRAAKNRGQQNFTDQELGAMLFAHGDAETPLPSTIRVLDEIVTDFIIGLCFEADRCAELAGRQKIKLDDIKFACRKDPLLLGKIEEMMEKRTEISKVRKMLDPADEKLSKAKIREMAGDANQKDEEELGEADDDVDTQTIGGKSGTGGK